MNRHKKYFEIDDDSKVNCPVCQSEVPKVSLTAHFSSKHGPKKTCCMVCLAVLPAPTARNNPLRTHIIKKHQIKPVCKICGQVAFSVYHLEAHMNKVHNHVKDAFCHRCGRSFAHKILLRKHLRVTCGVEDWQCTLCPKTFCTKEKMSNHLKPKRRYFYVRDQYSQNPSNIIDTVIFPEQVVLFPS